jgi:hypothetical protein
MGILPVLEAFPSVFGFEVGAHDGVHSQLAQHWSNELQNDGPEQAKDDKCCKTSPCMGCAIEIMENGEGPTQDEFRYNEKDVQEQVIHRGTGHDIPRFLVLKSSADWSK